MSHPHGPPPEDVIRRREAGSIGERDVTPAVGTRGAPSRWEHDGPAGDIPGQGRHWSDSRWSFLYDKGTRYARSAADAAGTVRGAARRMRSAPEPTVEPHGPFLHAPVWTWEVPLYFWAGGIASGSAFVAVACDAAGDERAATLARRLTLAAVLPCAPLLILDLGRPLRFLHMLRIFKVRSPMSMGAWCLSAFSGTAFAAAAADFLGFGRSARASSAATAVLGTYLGSYTGVLLASTAVPVWSRSRALLPPIFICTAAGGGAAANRLLLAAAGAPAGHATREALGIVEAAAMLAELALSEVNERRLGEVFGRALEQGEPGRRLRFARRAVMAGLTLHATRGRGGPWPHHGASVLYLAAALGFRLAWVGAGRTSAHDDEAAALAARRPGRATRRP